MTVYLLKNTGTFKKKISVTNERKKILISDFVKLDIQLVK